MTINISADDAITALRAEVKGNEEFIYQEDDCCYVYADAPSCLVGKALFRLGVSIDDLTKMDRSGNSAIRNVDLPEGVYISPEAREVFYAAQRSQDDGDYWGTALEMAGLVYKNLA